MRPGTLLRWNALKNILIREIEDNSIILDIGGYDGYISYQINNMFSNLEIIVVDLDKSGLTSANKRGLKTLYASTLKLPLENNSVDAVFCLDLIEHVKEDYIVIKEISRVLKQNGKVILTTPSQNGVSFPFLSKERIDIINKEWGHARKGYSLKDINELFKDAGLIVEKTNKYFNLFTRFIYRFSILSNIPLRGRGLLYRLILKLEPYVKYGAEEHIIVGEKVNSS